MSRPTGLLRIRQVLARIPVSRAYFYELVSADERLRPIKFGALSFWTVEQIDALERRIRDGRQAAPSDASKHSQQPAVTAERDEVLAPK
jgi:predicted DNA-binding transcriptional regulator AlpA